jgi:hypothetical protein
MSVAVCVRFDSPTYDVLFCEARRRGISIPELVRQTVGCIGKRAYLPPELEPPPGYERVRRVTERTLELAEAQVVELRREVARQRRSPIFKRRYQKA